MSFPKDLDEYTDDEIVAELRRRLQCVDEEPGAYNEDFMPKINGKFFRCECGCNVFRKPKPVSRPNLFECNSCEALFEGK